MKFTCSRQDLLDAATNVQRAVSTKSNIPALEGILIKAQKETLSLSGYDLEIGITTSIPASIEEEDELIVSARLFGDIIRKLNSDTVCVSGDATNVITIQGGHAEFSIPVSPASEFPEIPAVTDGKSLTLPRELLLEKVWDGSEFVDENALSVAVGRLRAKLGEAPIKTVYGVGYTWEAGR